LVAITTGRSSTTGMKTGELTFVYFSTKVRKYSMALEFFELFFTGKNKINDFCLCKKEFIRGFKYEI